MENEKKPVSFELILNESSSGEAEGEKILDIAVENLPEIPLKDLKEGFTQKHPELVWSVRMKIGSDRNLKSKDDKMQNDKIFKGMLDEIKNIVAEFRGKIDWVTLARNREQISVAKEELIGFLLTYLTYSTVENFLQEFDEFIHINRQDWESIQEPPITLSKEKMEEKFKGKEA